MDELATITRRVKIFLRMCGKRTRCQYCQQSVSWFPNKQRYWVCFNSDLEPHLPRCPNYDVKSKRPRKMVNGHG